MSSHNMETALRSIQEDGYAILRGVLPEKECEELSLTLDKVYAELGGDETAYQSSVVELHRSRFIYNIHNKDYRFVQYIDHPMVFPLLARLLGEDFALNFYNARGANKVGYSQALHIDSRVPSHPQYPLMVQAIWMIDDFTKANGATRVVPRSHLSGAFPDKTKAYPDERIVEGKRGDVLIYNSSLWHGASECTAENARRWAVIATYARWFIKPSMDFTKNCPPELYAILTPQQKQLFGFNSIPPHDEKVRVNTKTPLNTLPERWR